MINEAGFNPKITLGEDKVGVWYLDISLPKSIANQTNQLVTTKLLGKVLLSGFGFENPDGSPLTIGSDYFGKKRDQQNPTAGPFETSGNGRLHLKVWKRSR
ncbi:MAG: hypothetical protein GY751_15350 [Bacteroidetes bacterium]|nr:hypothetical protein [Bacteroidota bacterium]